MHAFTIGYEFYKWCFDTIYVEDAKVDIKAIR